MSRPLATLQIVVLAAWLGATALFVASVAPSAFAVLPTRSLAGALVGRVLPVLSWAGMLVGAMVFAVEALRGAGWRSPVAVGGLLTAFACAIAELVVRARIERLRAAIGTALDALPPGDPQRATFGRLHAVSVGWLGIAILAAIAATFFLARRLGRA